MSALPWLIRREVWEHRAVYIVPMVFLGLLALVYTYGLLAHGPGHMVHIEIDDSVLDLRQMIEVDAGARQAFKLAAGGLPFLVPSIVLNAAMLFVWFFYLTDALYAERRDRSVLFWKSLPVDDTTTVLSKLLTAMVLIPLITLAGILICALLMTVANTVFVWTVGESAWELIWSHFPVVTAPVALLYALLVQSLWYAPIFGWLLLASAWARRAPALWALLPPAAVALLEGTILRSSRFLELIGDRLKPIVPTAFRDSEIERWLEQMHGSQTIDWSKGFASLIDPGAFLIDPGMWGGLLIAAIFVTGAIGLRRYRDET